MVFNGEIYNYLALKQLLSDRHQVNFITTSDTEVLLYMYKFYGKELLTYIQWMFAFVIYDKQQDLLFIARDFVWQKPLVYAITQEWFAFASEIPVLFALLPSLPKDINQAALQVYCIDNLFHLPGTLSPFKQIHKLAPATYMVVQQGEIKEQQRYARLTKIKCRTGEISEVDFLYDKLEQMKPKDVGYASFLSGGIDSSFVCSGLKQHEEQPVDAYTLRIWTEDQDYQRSITIAQKLGLDQHTITLESSDLLDSVDESIRQFGEPYFHITSVFADLILQETKKKHKVMFTWAGGDECYYGYNNALFLSMDLFFMIKKCLPNWVLNRIDRITKQKYSLLLFADKESFKEHYYLTNLRAIAPLFATNDSLVEAEQVVTDLIQEFKDFVTYDTYVDFSYMFGLMYENMHSLVIQADLVGMKNSIEIRSLFLEKEVIESAYALPLWKKISRMRLHEGKEILRKQLKSLFGKEFLYAKKIGFGVHYNFKQKFEDTYKERIYHKITSLLNRWIFSPTEIHARMENFQWNFNLIMKLYALEVWYTTFIDPVPLTHV